MKVNVYSCPNGCPGSRFVKVVYRPSDVVVDALGAGLAETPNERLAPQDDGAVKCAVCGLTADTVPCLSGRIFVPGLGREVDVYVERYVSPLEMPVVYVDQGDGPVRVRGRHSFPGKNPEGIRFVLELDGGVRLRITQEDIERMV